MAFHSRRIVSELSFIAHQEPSYLKKVAVKALEKIIIIIVKTATEKGLVFCLLFLCRMGGHSKKAGKGGGGGGGGVNRGRHLASRKKLTKDPGVPDLKRLGEKLEATARKKSLSLLSLRSGGVGFGRKKPSSFLPCDLHSTPVPSTVASSFSQSEEQRILQQRNDMTRLALHTAERTHEYELPQGMLYGVHQNDDNDGDEYSGYRQQHQPDQSLRRFFKEFQKVVDNCNVLLQVVDARDPLGCRLKQLEQSIRSTHGDRKDIIIVLNKVDLLPSKEVVDAWVYYFENVEHIMCIPFAATAKGSNGQLYIQEMFQRLRNLARNEENGERKALVVGVIGYPNVGKSSIINALKRKSVVGVANMPGYTTGNTEIELKGDLRVMDCPGVVAAGEDSGDVVLRNAVRVSDLANPFPAVERLLERCSTARVDHGDCEEQSEKEEKQERLSPQTWDRKLIHPLALFYEIGSFSSQNPIEFIHHVGLRRGRLLKGGEVDEETTARMILQDWNDGRIPYYTLPPSVNDFSLKPLLNSDTNTYESPQLISSAAAEAMSSITIDGLPTFHLFTSRLMEGRKGTKSYSR